jgi:hypothetical protein
MAQPPTQSCGNCRYFVPLPEEDNSVGDTRYDGECRRYPLHIPFDNAGAVDADWPCIDTGMWCGEWAPENPETIDEACATLARFVLLGDRTAACALADKLKD